MSHTNSTERREEGKSSSISIQHTTARDNLSTLYK